MPRRHPRQIRNPAPAALPEKARWRLIAPPLIVLTGLATYANSLRGPFVFDDHIAIVGNDNLRQVFPLSRFLNGSQPLTDLSFAISYAISKYETWSYHAANVAIHLAAALVLFGLVRRTLSRSPTPPRIQARSDFLALAISLLWLVHPLQTESVTYITQRSEALMGLFYLLTLYCTCRAIEGTRSGWWITAAILACAAGMFSKAVMVTAPVVVLLYDSILGEGVRIALRKRRPLYLGLAATWSLLFVVGLVQGVFSTDAAASTVGFSYTGVTTWDYFKSQPAVILHYLRLSIWPVGLCLDYGWPVASGMAIYLPFALLLLWLLSSAYLVIRGMFADAGSNRKSLAGLGFLGLSFLIILAPTSSFVPIKDLAFEHRMYLPLAFLLALLVILAEALINHLFSARSALQKTAGPALVAVCILCLAVLTHRRNELYANPVALWEQTVKIAPHNPRPRNALGYALRIAGEDTRALAHFDDAIAIDPAYAGAFANKGESLLMLRRSADAVAAFDKALQLSPNTFNADVHFYYGAALLESNRPDEAIEQFRIAIGKNPRHGLARYNLANALMRIGRPDQAVAVFRETIELIPDHAETHVNLGLALMKLGSNDEAIASFESALRAVRRRPSHDAELKAHYNLALILQSKHRQRQAADHFGQVLRLDPGHPGAMKGLRALDAEPRTP